MPNIKIWSQILNMDDFIGTFPGGTAQGDECSIPDVYGRAIQFRLALKDSHEQKISTNEVNVWRGLITLLALQNYYDFPIEWEKVALSEGKDVFSKSLKLIPSNFSIFSQKNQQWNGTDFYVLKWNTGDGTADDICLYSPATLLYPVADWREKFPKFLNVEWFDQGGFIAPEQVLLESDKKIVAFWLGNIIQQIQSEVNEYPDNEMALMVVRLCNRYLEDLGFDLVTNKLVTKDLSSLALKAFSANNDELKPALGVLSESVEVTLTFDKTTVPAKSLFSDQVCCFYNPADVLFHLCSYKDNYVVTGVDEKDQFCAFLPLHFKMREYCSPYSLAQGISMSKIKKIKNTYIRVKVKLPNEVGMDMVKDYRLVETGPAQKDEAFFYSEDKSSQTGSPQVPLVAVWPNKVCDIWEKYYIMIEDNYRYGSLEVADVELESTSKYVVKTKYVPDAIPIALNRDEKQISIGMITLPVIVTREATQADISAEVAVDFGTSSTRVFAKPSGKAKREIFITDDSPLIVISHGNERNMMRDYFIAPLHTPTKETASIEGANGINTHKKVFSIYKRHDNTPRGQIEPIIDGVIYQAQADEKLEDQFGNPYLNHLITDLKWGDTTNRAYYKAFLKQLCLHVMIELYEKDHVNKITWRYALPEIMSPQSKGNVKTVWENDVRQYLEDMTSQIKCDIAQTFETESEAASRYFLYDASGDANAEQGYLVVDIGGGSTDLALWQKTDGDRKMKWHDSVNVAGRSMFTRWVAKYLGDFEKEIDGKKGVFSHMVQDVAAAQAQDDINGARNALVDRILNFYGESLKKVYGEKCDGGEPGEWPLELRTEIVKGVALLMFALGCQSGKLAKEGILAVLDQPGTFVIAVGGQGSQILDWTAHAIENTSVAKKFFELGYKAVRGPKFSRTNIEVQSSNDPKEEVARGLLENWGRSPESNLEESLKKKAKEEQIKVDQLSQEQEYISLFSKFMDEYHKVFVDKYSLPHITEANMRDALNRYTGDGRSSLVRIFMEVFYMKLLT